ncbi:sensor histidine kinase [Saccharothrix syringae]|uniref:histidine kinase n=1 Tax=Saccharothrix syringae TaxID=103733 RepID=A0A5Q0H6G0_SACSY|nr:sensor histidine kinase [Saccharothrix syringae]QFZ21563.1 sensor histidine kinase [Saccharothrix syringae]
MSTTISAYFRRALLATGHGLLLIGLAALSLASFILTVLSMAFLPLGVGFVLLPIAIALLRWTANQGRRLAGQADVEIPEPYLPRHQPASGLVLKVAQRTQWILTDAATWRDLLWALANTLVGFLAGLLPVTMAGYAVQGVVVEPLLAITGYDTWLWFGGWEGMSRGGETALAVLAGVVVGAAWLWVASLPVYGHAVFSRPLLSPTKRSQLKHRVQELADLRADAIDTQQAELLRIERDLHDGAQARLVAIGMKLGAVDRYLETDVDSARTLLTEAREASVKALDELRNLVRGIYPPVLAERGLGPAIEALAVDSPLEVELRTELPRRIQAALESAAYFAVNELLTNAAKHANAQHVSVVATLKNDLLRVTVTDDGRGGADLDHGTGLRGIARRCAVFDGKLRVHSPVGGPTAITLELPCASSSPRTSTS